MSKLREVTYNLSNQLAQCLCKMFGSEGIPCQHILFVLKGKCLNKIPSYYINNKWTKLGTAKPIFDCDGNIFEACSKLEDENKLISNAQAQFFKCMHMAGRSKEKLLVVINGASSIELQN